MPSRKSKPSPSLEASWKAARACSEQVLQEYARSLARELGPRDRVLLEGPMGAGKTTFARALLEGMGVTQPPEGSPSFAIAHEYAARGGREVVHLDLYRLKSVGELEDAGVLAYYWERDAIVVSEWLSRFEELEGAVLASVPKGARCWRVEISFADGESERDLRIKRLT